MRKKELALTIIQMALVIGIMTVIMLVLGYAETHYTRTGFVKKRAFTTNDYYFYDNRGNVWEFQTDEELNPNMLVEVKMFTNCTMDDIEDDMIIDYQVIEEELKIEIEK